MDSEMALVLAALAAFLLVGLLVEYRIFLRGRSRASASERQPLVRVRRRDAEWYGVGQSRQPTQPATPGMHVASGTDVPMPQRQHARQPRARTDTPRLDGYVRDDELQPRSAADTGDVIVEHGRAGDFDMLYDPYDGGQSYESPW